MSLATGSSLGKLFAAMLLPLLLLSSSPSLMNVMSAATQIQQPALSACNNSLIPKVDSAEALLDSNAATSLAEHAAGFIAATHGQRFSVFSVSPSYSFDTSTCSNLRLKVVNVNFYLPGSKGSKCGDTDLGITIQVTEDPSLRHVVSIQVPTAAVCPHQVSDPNSTTWDGYQVHTTYGGSQTNQVYSTVSFANPSVSQNSDCTQSPYYCAMVVWAGLSNTTYNQNPFIAQTGTEGKMYACNPNCPTPTYFGWYEFYYKGGPNIVPCTGDTLNAGDSMQAFAENGYYWGGSSNAYRTYLFDDTGTGWVCPSGTANTTTAPSGTGITDYAETILERPTEKAIGGPSILPNFDSGNSFALQDSQECYYLSSLQNPLQCTGFYNTIQTEIEMVNSCSGTETNNISTSSIDSSSDFTETLSTACGTV